MFPKTISRRLACKLVASGVTGAALSAPAAANPFSPGIVGSLLGLSAIPADVSNFYAARRYRPLWLRNGQFGAESDQLLQLLSSAALDGLDPARYRTGELRSLLARAGGNPGNLVQADMQLSAAFSSYVRDVRRPRGVEIYYVDEGLKPARPTARQVLEIAAAAPSLADYLGRVGWMNPIYADLRKALGDLQGVKDDPLFVDSERRLRLNLDRASVLPTAAKRYVLVDSAAAKLFYFEHGELVETMRVVVGTQDMQTPMMAALIRYASLNPYWHVPPDLTRDRIAPRVLREGVPYLTGKGYEVVAEWKHDAAIIDPAAIDWKAVAAGDRDIYVRQRPGPTNSMGNVKFMFPNKLGIYLHDTPTKSYFQEMQRLISAGCVRLEDAERFGELLFGRTLEPDSARPEQSVMLDEPVPVYMTYLTRAPEKNRIVERPDVYKRDSAELA